MYAILGLIFERVGTLHIALVISYLCVTIQASDTPGYEHKLVSSLTILRLIFEIIDNISGCILRKTLQEFFIVGVIGLLLHDDLIKFVIQLEDDIFLARLFGSLLV